MAERRRIDREKQNEEKTQARFDSVRHRVIILFSFHQRMNGRKIPKGCVRTTELRSKLVKIFSFGT